MIPYARHSMTVEDIAAVSEVLQGPSLTQGETVERFEAALCKYTGARHAVAVSSGTAALHLAYVCMGTRRASIPAITFVATANAARQAGAEVSFIDVDESTGLGMWDGKPGDWVSVDFAGNWAGPANIQDAAHSFGASYEIDHVRYRVGGCAHSAVTTLSFHPCKTITTGEGGALLTNDEDLANHARRLRSHALEHSGKHGPWHREQNELGFNYRLSDIHAALGLSQLSRIDALVDRRREIAATYDQAFADLRDKLVPLRHQAGSAVHLYIVQAVAPKFEHAMNERAALKKHLEARGIGSQVHYLPVPWNQYHASRDEFPGAQSFYSRSLSIPCFPSMTSGEVERVIDAVRDWATS